MESHIDLTQDDARLAMNSGGPQGGPTAHPKSKTPIYISLVFPLPFHTFVVRDQPTAQYAVAVWRMPVDQSAVTTDQAGMLLQD